MGSIPPLLDLPLTFTCTSTFIFLPSFSHSFSTMSTCSFLSRTLSYPDWGPLEGSVFYLNESCHKVPPHNVWRKRLGLGYQLLGVTFSEKSSDAGVVKVRIRSEG